MLPTILPAKVDAPALYINRRGWGCGAQIALHLPIIREHVLQGPRPRCVTIEDAARYVGLTPAGYRAAAARGVFPGPIPGTNRYDIKAIDAAIDRLSGMESVPPEDEPSAYDKWKARRNESRSEARPYGQEEAR
jgi:hypothetical protein